MGFMLNSFTNPSSWYMCSNRLSICNGGKRRHLREHNKISCTIGGINGPKTIKSGMGKCQFENEV